MRAQTYKKSRPNLAYVAATRVKENLFISYPRHNSKSKDEIAPSRYFARFFNKK